MKHSHPNLRAYFKATGITQEEFAAELGITQAYVSAILRGKQTPSLPLAVRIAEHARIPVESLVGSEVSA